MPRRPGRPRRIPPPEFVPSPEAYRLRQLLAALDALPLATLLRELGAVLYNREIRQWAVLTDIADELLDEATLAARRRLFERWQQQETLKAGRRKRTD